MKMKAPLLSVRGLHKTYPNGVIALKGIDLDVYPGEFLIVIGLSGSGKSTLLRCLNRLVDPTAGKIIFKDRAIEKAQGKEARQVRRKIGMIFQHFNLIPRQSVLQNVLMGRLGATNPWKSLFHLFAPQDIVKARNYLDLVGIADKSDLRADQLSGGQQQRVAIARALAQNPELLLADEPVASLDPATSTAVMEYLRKVNRELGITVVCNLHFLSLVREYATRVIALRAGEIVFEGDPKNIDETWFKKIYGETAKDINVR
jgi:phosphonate transport system ATP-binding protein